MNKDRFLGVAIGLMIVLIAVNETFALKIIVFMLFAGFYFVIKTLEERE